MIGGGEKSAEDVVEAVTSGRGVDVALICASSSDSAPVALAGDLCRDRGRVVGRQHAAMNQTEIGFGVVARQFGEMDELMREPLGLETQAVFLQQFDAALEFVGQA